MYTNAGTWCTHDMCAIICCYLIYFLSYYKDSFGNFEYLKTIKVFVVFENFRIKT